MKLNYNGVEEEEELLNFHHITSSAAGWEMTLKLTNKNAWQSIMMIIESDSQSS
jgi:hypothetical protein